MKKKTDEIILPHKDHKLKTRRDFLAQGLMAGVGYALAPSLLSMLKINEVHAAEGCANIAAGAGKTPVIIIDLAGGGSIAGSNVMVGGQGGQLNFLSNYTRLGLPAALNPGNNGMVNSEFGLAFHRDSGMLRGLRAATTAGARSKIDGAVFCASSDNDTQNNPHNPVYWLSKAGATGSLVQTTGTRNSRSGGRSKVPNISYDPTLSPVLITKPEDCVGLVSLGKVGDIFNQTKAQKILKAMERMSERKLASFSKKTLPDQVKDVVSCGFDTGAFTSGQFSPSNLDPAQDTDVRAVFPNVQNTARNFRQERKEASIAKMVLDGYVGVGTIEMGGYDYHSRTRQQTDAADERVGQLLGRIFSLAERKQTDVMVYVFTDGGISSNGRTTDTVNGVSKLRFTNDDEQRAATFMMVYKHESENKSDFMRHTSEGIANAKRQIGHFSTNIAVDRSANVTSNNVENLAKAVVANYLALHNEENRLQEVVGSNPFGNKIEDYLVFKG